MRMRAITTIAGAVLVSATLGAEEVYSQTAPTMPLLQGQRVDGTQVMVLNDDGGLAIVGEVDDGVIPHQGAGVRMMWYPRKAAFRAGRVEGVQWDDANVGIYSAAMGFSTTASGFGSTAMGLGTTASAAGSTAAGWNTTASGDYSTAMGNSTTASGLRSTAIGFALTASGSYSTAMGRSASTAAREGAFVYGDASTETYMTASTDNQFSVRAAGGYRFFSNSDLTAGVTLAAGASSWNTVSDWNRKELFLPLDGEEILLRLRAVPVTSWRYIAEEDRTVRHIGPMAQDWGAAFPELGGDGLTINTGDFDGVNLAAIQALEARTADLEELRDELRAARSELAVLRAQAERVGQLESQLAVIQSQLRALAADGGTAAQPATPTSRER